MPTARAASVATHGWSTLYTEIMSWISGIWVFFLSLCLDLIHHRDRNLSDLWPDCHCSLVPRPLPLRRGLVHTVCTCTKYSVIFSVKSLVYLHCPYVEHYTNQEIIQSFLWNRFQQWFNLQNPSRLPFRRDSIIFTSLQSNKVVTNEIYHKGPMVATEILTCHSS